MITLHLKKMLYVQIIMKVMSKVIILAIGVATHAPLGPISFIRINAVDTTIPKCIKNE